MRRSRLITAWFRGLPYPHHILRAFKGSYGLLGRSVRALRFAEEHGVKLQRWMLSPVWTGWIGCEHCQEGGASARCWGNAGCHGYLNGCGCSSCVREDQVNSMEYV